MADKNFPWAAPASSIVKDAMPQTGTNVTQMNRILWCPEGVRHHWTAAPLKLIILVPLHPSGNKITAHLFLYTLQSERKIGMCFLIRIDAWNDSLRISFFMYIFLLLYFILVCNNILQFFSLINSKKIHCSIKIL